LLREVEKNNKISSREMEELLWTVSQSEKSRQLDSWLQSYCTTALNDSASAAGGTPSNAAAQPILESVPPPESTVEQSTQGQPESPDPDGKVNN
jgi:hypothetical protein